MPWRTTPTDTSPPAGIARAPAVPAARRQDHPTRGVDVLHRPLVRQRQSHHAPLVDKQTLDVAGCAHRDPPLQHGAEEIPREGRPRHPVRFILMQPRGQGRPVRPLPPGLERRVLVAQRARMADLGARAPTEGRIRPR